MKKTADFLSAVFNIIRNWHLKISAIFFYFITVAFALRLMRLSLDVLLCSSFLGKYSRDIDFGHFEIKNEQESHNQWCDVIHYDADAIG